MNTLLQKITAAIGLTLSLGLASCQKESLITPDQPTSGASPAVSNDISPTLPKNYKLIQCGQANLTYYADGRLKQVTQGANVRGSLVYRRQYVYDDVAHRIDVSTYMGDKMILFDMYFIDGQTGLCHQSEQVDYTILDNPTPSHTQLNARWYYQYNEKGQLTRCQNLFLHSSDRTEYTYNADDDLIKMATYDRVGSQDGVLIHTLTLTYNQSSLSRSTLLADKYPINAGWMRLPVPDQTIEGQPVPDQYLPIFGKPSKHLITGVVQTQLPGNQTVFGLRYSYTLNADSYVTERKEFDTRTSSLLDTRPYDYQVTTPGFQH